MKRVIINADDFGLSDTINQSIITAFKCGILSSTTLLVKRDATADAVKFAEAHSELGVGLHLDLDCFFPFESNGYFGTSIEDIDKAVYEQVTASHMQAIKQEIESQIEMVYRFGLQPTHIDGHHNTHLLPRILPEVINIMRNFPINKIRFARKFYGERSELYTGLKRMLDNASILYPRLCVEIDEILPLGRIFEKLESQQISEVIVHTDLPSGEPENQWRVEQFEYVSDARAFEAIDRLEIKRVSYAALDV